MSDIDKMEAGSELDRLIAERVMGMEVAGPECRPLRFVQMGNVVHPDHVPKFSTTIACAWEVVEKLIATARDDVQFTLTNCGHPTGKWAVDFVGDDKIAVIAVHADTVPLAICRAALKAVAND